MDEALPREIMRSMTVNAPWRALNSLARSCAWLNMAVSAVGRARADEAAVDDDVSTDEAYIIDANTFAIFHAGFSKLPNGTLHGRCVVVAVLGMLRDSSIAVTYDRGNIVGDYTMRRDHGWPRACEKTFYRGGFVEVGDRISVAYGATHRFILHHVPGGSLNSTPADKIINGLDGTPPEWTAADGTISWAAVEAWFAQHMDEAPSYSALIASVCPGEQWTEFVRAQMPGLICAAVR